MTWCLIFLIMPFKVHIFLWCMRAPKVFTRRTKTHAPEFQILSALSITVMLVDLSFAIMHVTISVAIIQLDVSGALMQMIVSASNMWVTIFIVFIQVGVSVAIMQVVLSAVHNCFYCKIQVSVSVISM